jgi:cytochrome c553
VKRWILRTSAALALISIVGFIVVATGIVPIAASSGHWPITEWILHFVMKRSVATHSLFIETPRLDDPALVLKGATHYHAACVPCHGSPGQPLPVIARGMTPAPPRLADRIAAWSAEELFYVVKHGVKFTGMPAWPAQQRDDEVWAMAAFLQVLPGLGAAEYHGLAVGAELAPVETAPLRTSTSSERVRTTLRESCARCHGHDGLGRGSAFPRLAGQRAAYLRNALEAYARGERHSGIMQPIAAGLDPETIRVLADHFAALPGAPAPREAPLAVAPGEAIARHGVPSRNVPSCVDCHGPDSTSHAAYPLHAGQHPEYLLLQLQLFQSGHRGGSPHARLMQPIAARLTPEQMRDVAAYYGALPALRQPSAR